MKFKVPSLQAISVFVLLGGLLTACSASDDTKTKSPESSAASTSESTPTSAGPGAMQEPVDLVTGLTSPWSIAFFDGTPLVSQRDNGIILELVSNENGSRYTSRRLGRIDGVFHDGEGGLLGLTTDDKYLYAYFTTRTDNRIARYELRGKPGSLSLGRATTILDSIPRAWNHNGGRIAFGPDGKLYATTGDVSETTNSQNLDSLSGKILRMNADGSIPADNPFEGSRVFSYGHRNPQGITWDKNGVMYASEFGQDTWDELNVIEAGKNYGWPEVEGIAKTKGFVDPVQQWNPSEASPSGITIANGSIFIANLRGRRLREVPLSSRGAASEHFVDGFGRIRDAVTAPDGSLWILTNNTDGRGEAKKGDDRIVRLSFG